MADDEREGEEVRIVDDDNIDSDDPIMDDDDDADLGHHLKANAASVVLSPERPEVVVPAPTGECRVTNDSFSQPDHPVEEEQWRSRKKHVFILSSAGKPVFSRYGDESDFSELFGILQVLISMAQSNSAAAGECLRRVTAGPEFVIHFYTAGELSYVMVTRTEESTKSCVRQLRLLHLQMLSVLPTVNAVLSKSPGYDVRRIFSHADASVMRQLIKRMSWDPQFMFRAASIVPLPLEWRKDVERVLIDARSQESAPEDHLYSLILHRGSIVASVSPKHQQLHIDDFLLLINFVTCVSASQRGEIWAPICLPRFNDTGYLWCYCNTLRSSTALGGGNDGYDDSAPLLVQLATAQDAFPALSKRFSLVHNVLDGQLLLDLREHCTTNPTASWKMLFGSQPPPPPCMQWFAACSDAKQLVMTALPPTVAFSKTARKSVFRMFAKLRDKLAILSRASQPVLIHSTEDQSFVIVKGKSLEGLALFLPCTPRKTMVELTTKALKAVSSKDAVVTIAKAASW